MRKAGQLMVVFVVSALVTVGLASVVRIGGPQRSRPIGAAPSDAGRRYATPHLPAIAEHLREAQDEYLKILQSAPADAEAFRGLVAVRRQLARENAMVLRRQASAYRQLIARGADTPEHYSPQSMEMLASASLRAAGAIEAEQHRTPRRAPAGTGSDGPPRTAARGSPGPGPVDRRAATRAANPSAPAPKPPAVSLARTRPTTTTPAAPPQRPPAAAPPVPQSPAPPAPPVPPSATPGAAAPPPAAGQPSAARSGSEETIAVVSPPAEPSLTQSQGDLVSIDCQKRTFVLRGTNGDEEYQTAPSTTIYVRGAKSERLADFCRLRGFLGHTAMAWSIPDGDRRVARWVSIVMN